MTELTRQTPDWTDTAPIKFRAAHEMLATPDEVWAALADHERWPEWFEAIDGAESTGGEGLGSTRAIWIRKWRVDEEFIVWDEPRSWGFTVLVAEGPLGWLAESLNERIDIQVLAPDRVRVTYLMAFQPRSGFKGRLLGRAKKGMVKKAWRDLLRRKG